MDTTKNWFEYLHTTKNISKHVITEAGLFERGSQLGIPIFDEVGNHLFSKYRRHYASTDGPKYLYEPGSSAKLYGIHFPILPGPIYFVEGELDCLAMRTMGYNAFTSTGGAMTFRYEWLLQIPRDREMHVLYDNDEAGIKGAVRLANILKKGVYTWVPPMFGKDVGDLLAQCGPDDARRIIDDASRNVAFDISGNRPKQTIYQIKEQAQSLDVCVGKKFLLQLLFDYKMEHRPATKRYTGASHATAIDRARAYPIQNLVKFRQRKHTCLWHTEKTGSLHLYPDNHLFCHGQCNRAYDVIDVYMHLNPGTKFLQAVEALNKLT